MGDIRGTRTVEELVPHLNWIEDSMRHYLLVHLPEAFLFLVAFKPPYRHRNCFFVQAVVQNGFRKEEVDVGLAYPGYVTISGERIVNDKKCTYFGQALKLPENLDMKKVGQSFEDEMLTLTFPKRTDEEEDQNGNPSTTKKSLQEEEEEEKQKEVINEQNQTTHEQHCHAESEEQSKQTDDDNIVNATDKEMRKNGGILERVINLLRNNILLTLASAFALGVFASKRFESNGE
ncbi:hypothetical protein Goari_007019 [Gossypium aridum]|uniref:SHSP domain-containing protein n=1 Tax=Gossypium aridum TaxID=34290 RepID=A0A7J8XQY8_GOSAI|nr:hypothetical protein [Gossypium aridum]